MPEYIDPLMPIKIICKQHGEFYMTPLNHILGYGCPVCDHEDPASLEEKLLDSWDKLLA